MKAWYDSVLGREKERETDRDSERILRKRRTVKARVVTDANG